MSHSSVTCAAILIAVLLMPAITGCSTAYKKELISPTVSLVTPNATRHQSLPLEVPVTLYVTGTAIVDQTIAAPVKFEAAPASLHWVAEIHLNLDWRDGGYSDYRNPKYLHPLAVEEARRIARHLGCNALIIKKKPQFEIIPVQGYFTSLMGVDSDRRYKQKTIGITFVAGSDR